MFIGVSTNSTSNPLIQLGDAGGIEATGYTGTGATHTGGGSGFTNFTTGFGIRSSAATNVLQGGIVLSLENAATFTWVADGQMSYASETTQVIGTKSLSAELDRVRITTVNGSDTFDAGVINISYE